MTFVQLSNKFCPRLTNGWASTRNTCTGLSSGHTAMGQNARHLHNSGNRSSLFYQHSPFQEQDLTCRCGAHSSKPVHRSIQTNGSMSHYLNICSRLYSVDNSGGKSDNSKSELIESETDSEEANNPALQVYVTPYQSKTDQVVPGKGPPPDPPTTCCMSGCANCVWIQYAEDMRKYYADGSSKAREEIMKIEDANLRAFLLLEIG